MSTRTFEPSRQYLRQLVLDYLLHNAYSDTARAFASESAAVVHADVIREGLAGDASSDEVAVQPMEGVSTSEEGDDPALSTEALDLIRLRREIKLHILSGRVDDATQLLNSRFPAVLQEDESDSPFPPLSMRHNMSSPFSRLQYTSQFSMKPIHVALNLRILAFIEAARTVPLSYPGDSKRSSYVSSKPAGTDSSPDTDSEHQAAEHQAALLHRAQGLYNAVGCLQNPRDREFYRKELNEIGGLLAYKVPEAGPLAKYLTQERRELIADQVNGAILYHMGKPAASYIELFARQTSTVMSVMRDNNVAPTPQMRNILPTNAVAQQPIPPQTKSTSGKPDKAELEKSQVCLPFNLHSFLDSS